MKKYTLDYKNPPKYSTYKTAALLKNREFTINENQFYKISLKSCHYCGKEGPSGIDRKNNNKGYTIKNCLPCCKHCNYARGALSYHDFHRWLNRFKTIAKK